MSVAKLISIEADNLSITRGKVEVVKNLLCSVKQGEVFGLLGGSSAGKATKFLAFLGFLKSNRGKAKINGIDVASDSRATRQAIAYLPELANLYPRHI